MLNNGVLYGLGSHSNGSLLGCWTLFMDWLFAPWLWHVSDVILLSSVCIGVHWALLFVCALVPWVSLFGSIHACCCVDRFAAGSGVEQTGRATCGESEGREYVSNYNPTLVQGVKCVEYWGRSNSSPVLRLFGGPTA